MPSWDDVEVGDKVVMERTVEVTRVVADGLWGVAVGDKEGLEGYTKKADHNRLKSVEKPVVTFKPGDRVRSKTVGYEYLILNGRKYVDLTHMIVQDSYELSGFTSERFELVED